MALKFEWDKDKAERNIKNMESDLKQQQRFS